MADASRLAPGLQQLPGGDDSWRRKLEVPELIHFIDSYETPFYTFTSKVNGKAPTPDYKFWTQEHRPLLDKAVITTGSTWGSLGETTIEVGSDASTVDDSYWYKNLLVKNVSNANPWTAVVTGVGTADNLSAGEVKLKHLAGSAPADPTAGESLIFMSTAYPDGEQRGQVISKDNTRDYNYTQIMRMPIEITKRMAASTLHGKPDKLAIMKRDAIRQWKRLVERAFLFGERYEDTAVTVDGGGKYERTATEGFVSWIERVGGTGTDTPIIDRFTYGQFSLSEYTWDQFMDDMNTMFQFKSSNRKMMLCPRDVIARFNNSSFLGGTSTPGTWDFNASTNTYGIAKWSFTTPFGTLDLVECPALNDYKPAFTGDSGSKYYGVIVDPQSVRQRVLEDVHWEDTSVNGHALVGQQELYADIGLEFNSPELNGLIIWD